MKKIEKKSIIALIFASILSLSSFAVIIPLTFAHNPAWEIESYAYVVAAPNPVGINQNVYVTMWVDWPLPGANMGNDVRRHDYSLTITKPDSTEQILEWPIVDDTTSVQFAVYVPDQVGVHTLTFDYGGQTYEWNEDRTQKTWTNDVFLPASATTTISVQEDPIPEAITSYPLPTEYWTREIIPAPRKRGRLGPCTGNIGCRRIIYWRVIGRHIRHFPGFGGGHQRGWLVGFSDRGTIQR